MFDTKMVTRNRVSPALFLSLCACAHSTTSGIEENRSSSPESYQAKLIHSGKIECFTAEFMNAQTKPPRCEVSAVEVIGSRIFLGSDKPIPGEKRSSIFFYDRAAKNLRGTPENFVSSQYARSAVKFEAFARLQSEPIVLGATGFDRIRDDGKWDGFNTLLAWNAKQPDSIQVINPSVRANVLSSKDLRQKFKSALKSDIFPEGPPYFKIEGLAVLPDKRILFGVRESGKRYDDFNFHRIILGAKLSGSFPNLAIQGELKTLFDFTDDKTSAFEVPLGISSLAYDAKRDGLWILTSYEVKPTDVGVGGYLWFLPMSQFERGTGAPQLIKTDSGKPLHFAHKSEGLSVLENGNLLVFYDDDRITGRTNVEDPSTQFHRALHESYFSLVQID